MANKTLLIKAVRANFIFIFFVLNGWMLPIIARAQHTDTTKLTVADIVIIHSKILNENRKIYIYNPNTDTIYFGPQPTPVLYLIDGDVHTAFVASQIQYLSKVYNDLPPMLVVGISNYQYDRMRDLTPTHTLLDYFGTVDTSAQSPNRTTGGGEAFLRFVKEEVMPYIEQRYKTTSYKILSGHSLGGLMSLYCFSAHADWFNAYIAISPSLWWDNGRELKRADTTLSNENIKNKKLFFSDGSEGNKFHNYVLSYDTLLRKKDLKGLTYKYIYYPDETHGSEPVKAEYDALKFIYAKWKPAATDTTAALITKFYLQLSLEYGYNVLPDEPVIVTLAYQYVNTPDKLNDAIDLLEMNIKNHPASYISYAVLGDAYLKKSDKKKAIVAYKKAIELNPKDEDSKKKLKSLE